MAVAPSNLQLCLEPTAITGDAQKSGPVVRVWPVLVVLIFGTRRLAEVDYPVVAAVAVDVIDLASRPRALRVQPGETMR